MWRNVNRSLVYMEALCTSTRRHFYIAGYKAQPCEFDPHNVYHWEPGPVFFNYGETIVDALRVPGVPVVSWMNVFSDRCYPPCPYCARFTDIWPCCKRWFCNHELGPPFPIFRHHPRETQKYCPHCATSISVSAWPSTPDGKPILLGRFG
jgi:hypothetical protein